MTIIKNKHLEAELLSAKTRYINQQFIFSTTFETNLTSIEELLYLIDTEDGFYWSNYDRTLEFLGLTPIVTVITNEENRFENIEQAYINLSNQIYSEKNKPIIFGGFCFDEKVEQSDIWNKFEHNELTLPKFLFIKEENVIKLLYCSADNEELNKEKIEAEIDHLLNRPSNNIVFNQEIINNNTMEYAEWETMLNKAKDKINSGIIQKIVLSRTCELEFTEEIPVSIIANNLLEVQKGSYIFLYKKNGTCFIGATPERLVQCDDKVIYSACVAGSIKRGLTEEEDINLQNELLNDPKNLQEHQYVVDVVEKAMELYANNVEIPSSPSILKNKFIQHLYTPLKGTLKETSTLLKVVGELHPTPALGGTPKEEALSQIKDLEPHSRGWYAAPIGWIDFDGNGEFAVAIRSGIIEKNKALLYAGCGVVDQSDPQSEYIETNIKFRPMLSALRGNE
ncbi:MAG: isochorismate synthase [Bacillales bacterium]|jgi:menaquinone-specific isochorismate synthase|nr:isochorismate synthase [Bacillales bacterium]